MSLLEPVVLYREDRVDSDHRDEIAVIREFFPIEEYRTNCAKRLVIGRYSVLPYYEELAKEINFLGGTLINSYLMHQWIASFEYYHDLKDFTFESWDSLGHTKYQGPFVIKGKTNSRKHQWDTHMYAETRKDALRVESELFNDSMIGRQGVIFRKYEPLRTFEIGINGIRFTNEFRFFYLRHRYLSHGYYWTTADQPELGECTPKMRAFADEVAKVAGEFANALCIDVAEKEDGDMILVELNDLQMSGLSMNDPRVLWGNMKQALTEVELL